jgi:preprotein translocase subunit SecA
LEDDKLVGVLTEEAKGFYNRKEEQLGHDLMASLERFAYLQVIDDKWKEHLREMDELKEGIHLRAYGQKDPLIEYKQEAFKMFTQMLDLIRDGVLELAFKLFPTQNQTQGGATNMAPRKPVRQQRMTAVKQDYSTATATQAPQYSEPMAGMPAPPPPPNAPKAPMVRSQPKVGRNDPCPCGSGKKYKNCHGEGL